MHYHDTKKKKKIYVYYFNSSTMSNIRWKGNKFLYNVDGKALQSNITLSLERALLRGTTTLIHQNQHRRFILILIKELSSIDF